MSALRSTAAGWGLGARLLRWGMAGVILFLLGLGVWMTNFVPALLRRFALIQLHKSWGAVAFGLAILRLLWRMADGVRPRLPAGMPRWQARAARGSHVALYALMVAMPLSGWVMVCASPVQDSLGIGNEVFGLFALPDPWVPGVERVAEAARAVHVALAVALAGLLTLHVAAALRHHLVDRDEVLARMLRGPAREAQSLGGSGGGATGAGGGGE